MAFRHSEERRIEFASKDGTRLAGILDIRSEKKCVIICHGIGGNSEEALYENLAKKFTSSGLSAFRFDFRGHSKSGGRIEDMTVSGEKEDLESAFNYLKKEGYTSIGILAASFAGGAVSLFLSEHNKDENIKAVVMWGAMVSYGENGFSINRPTLKTGTRLLQETRGLRPLEALRGIDTPILIIHAKGDQIVKYGPNAQAAKRLLGKKAELLAIDTNEHGLENQEYAYQEADKFFVRIL